jgi:hypothetical protein
MASRRRRLHAFIDGHRRPVLVAGVLASGFVVFVLLWFQPQKIFLNTSVNEPPAAQGRSIATGQFRSLEHGTTGRAAIVELPDGSHLLRFEGLDTLNGPDLHVYLSQVPAGDDARAYGEGFVDLGKLKGNKGNQNYEIPLGTDLSNFRSVVIWCKRFTVGFGVAALES